MRHAARFASLETALARSGIARSPFVRAIWALTLVAGISAVAVLGSHRYASRAHHRDGACIALDLAMAHGFIDEPRRKMVARAITAPTNPYAARFGSDYHALVASCIAVAERRWIGW
jgi:hypothetical protein